MIHAENNYKTYYNIRKIFMQYRDIFPYIRKDYIEEFLQKQQIIHESTH
jgi:hypothetical protein